MIDIIFNTYLPQFFDWVIETSIMASILVGLIFCVKILLRNRLTPRWHYLLWMILIVRLILPWSPGSSFSIYSILLNSYESITSEQSQSIGSIEKEQLRETNNLSDLKVVTDQERFDTPTPPTIVESKIEAMNNYEKQDDEPLSIHSVALYVWLTGVIVLGFTTYLANNRLQRYIKQQPVITDVRIVNIFESCKKSMFTHQNIPLLLAGKIPSPTVLGFFRPRVLLSSDQMNLLNEQQLRHVFHHELAHIKRRDVALNWLMYLLLIINWFNPIIWVAYVCMREDQELACDAYALTFMEEEENLSYGLTIISLLEHYSNYYQVPSLANLSRNKRTLKRRIFMIKKFQKKSYGWSILGIVAVVIISSLSLLNAHADGSNEKQEEQGKTKETATEEVESNGFDPRLKKFIAEQAEEFKNTTDIKEYTAKFDKLLSEFANQHTGYPTVEAAYDFENLRALIGWGAHLNYVISTEKQQGIDTAESMEVVKDTFEYIKQLLNDLDVVMNKNGKGETYGMLHQLDGEHVIELEKFTYGEQGLPAELKDHFTQRIQKKD